MRPPSRSSRTLLASLVLSAASLVACSSEHDEHTPSSSGGAASACERDSRKDTYAAGLAKTSDGVTVKLADAQPAPPRKGDNTLTMQVVDGAGKTVDGATLDNFFHRGEPIVAKGPIELQTHGSEIRFRNIYLRELGPDSR